MDIGAATHVMNSMIALVIALCFHEAAHALAAKLQGDDTAQRAGRLTLNPIPHMDPLGTVLFPLLGLISGAAIFGWAKPVPVNPQNLKFPKWGYVAVSLAGPAMNIVLCFLAILAHGFYQRHGESFGLLGIPFAKLLVQLVGVNAILAAFNLIPLPPLDGGSVVSALLPDDLRERFDAVVAPYAIFILMALSFAGALSWIGRVAQVIIGVSQQVALTILQ